jgi:hypothetical protein
MTVAFAATAAGTVVSTVVGAASITVGFARTAAGTNQSVGAASITVGFARTAAGVLGGTWAVMPHPGPDYTLAVVEESRTYVPPAEARTLAMKGS